MIGFKPNEADPCLLLREDKLGPCALNDVVLGIKKFFNITEAADLQDYLGIKIVKSKDGNKLWLGQPTIIKSLQDKFGDLAQKARTTLTPGTPGYVGVKARDESSLILPEQQTMFKSGVGTLLYLPKHSRPDITNAVRELSKTMDGATQCQWKEMCRVIKFVLQTSELRLKVWPVQDDSNKQTWKLKALSDSNFANDADTRISVYGYIVYYCGVPVSWKGKGMRSVVLSTTEAE